MLRSLRRRPDPASADPLDDAPIRRWVAAALAGDMGAAILAGVAARVFRFGFDDAVRAGSEVRVPYGLLALGLAVLWPVATALAGAYSYRVALFGVEELRRLLRAAAGLLAVIGIVHFVFQLDVARGDARGIVGLFILLVVVLSASFRMALRSRIGREHRRGAGRHRAVVCGAVEDVARVHATLTTRPGTPIEVVAYVADDLEPGDPDPAVLDGLLRLPSRDAISELRPSGIPFDILLRAGRPLPDELWTMARRAHACGVALAMAPERSDQANVAWSYVPLGSTPLLLVETPAMRAPQRIAKAVFDRVVGVLLLIALAPVFAVLAMAILVSDGRPVFFRHARVGKDGTPFHIWKFRTMVRDAEGRLFDLLSDEQRSRPFFKLQSDPRVTRVGRFLRRHSLDELPQLFNVLAGSMSLVGPRPQVQAEVSTYDARSARRLLVKPGMTGLWQVQGRNDVGWDEGVYLDLLYIEQWSPLLDLVIMARTVRTVVRPSGAY